MREHLLKPDLHAPATDAHTILFKLSATVGLWPNSRQATSARHCQTFYLRSWSLMYAH